MIMNHIAQGPWAGASPFEPGTHLVKSSALPAAPALSASSVFFHTPPYNFWGQFWQIYYLDFGGFWGQIFS